MSAAALAEALAAVRAALDRGDGAAAAAAVGAAQDACAALRARGERLEAPVVAELGRVVEACLGAAAAERDRLAAALDAAARSRRAADAYRER